jgi:hypothetical protein
MNHRRDEGDYINSKLLGIQYPLLDDYQRMMLNEIEDKLDNFEKIVKSSVTNYKDLFANGIIISGAPGTGKTYSIKKWLNELTNEGYIDGFNEFSGKISPVTLFKVLKEVSTGDDNKVMLLDDVDVFDKPDSLNILKAALNTSTDSTSAKGFRTVSYGTKGSVDSFEFKSFLIMITNETFTNLDGNIREHISAVLDRVHLMSVTLTPEDMMIKNLSIVEKFFNESNGLSDKIKDQLIDLFNTEIRELIDYNCFQNCRINLSVRFFMKLYDLQVLFGNSWRDFSAEYKRLKLDLMKQKSLEVEK